MSVIRTLMNPPSPPAQTTTRGAKTVPAEADCMMIVMPFPLMPGTSCFAKFKTEGNALAIESPNRLVETHKAAGTPGNAIVNPSAHVTPRTSIKTIHFAETLMERGTERRRPRVKLDPNTALMRTLSEVSNPTDDA